MAFPQGIDFRSTAAFVTDPPNNDVDTSGGFGVSYPRTTAQGNTVGWESFGGTDTTVTPTDSSSTVDARLAGYSGSGDGVGNFFTYRIDLPSAGTYVIALALGTAAGGNSDGQCELFDNLTSLGVIVPQVQLTGTQFADATGAVRASAADWITNNVTITKTFASTIARFKFGNQAGFWGVVRPSHIFIQASGTSIHADWGIPAEFGSTEIINQFIPEEFAASPATNLPISIEWTGGTAVIFNGLVPLEFGLTLAKTDPMAFDAATDIALGSLVPAEWQAALSLSPSIQMEFGETIISGYPIPIESGGGAASQNQIQVEFGLSVLADKIFHMDAGSANMIGYSVQTEWASNVAFGTSVPAEFGTSARSDSQINLEWIGGIAVFFDGTAPIEFGTTRRSDANIQADWTTPTLGNGAIFAEYGGSLSADAARPIEFGAGVLTDGSVPVEFAGSLDQGTIPIEFGQGIVLGSSLPSEFSSMAISTELIPAEWGGALTVITDARIPLDFLSTLTQGEIVNIEWTGATVVTFNGLIPAEFGLSITALGGASQETGTAVFKGFSQDIEFETLVLSQNPVIIEWTGVVPLITAVYRRTSSFWGARVGSRQED